MSVGCFGSCTGIERSTQIYVVTARVAPPVAPSTQSTGCVHVEHCIFALLPLPFYGAVRMLMLMLMLMRLPILVRFFCSVFFLPE